ncbi:hypothetical protein SUGI_1064330 [Cryptomeria japonica]|nr:hypothetical protein SUGI_1064330 [Cryptomeria japonica]
MDVRKKSIRDLSPDWAKVSMGTRHKAMKKVQVVYYLSRGGQLEHPHFMEVVMPYNQELRLRDVMDRLAILRGKEMPSLFSWSYKRRYKSGYVWNDLSEDDVILPVDGVEYVLKASELFEDFPEKYQHCINNVCAPNATQEPAMGVYFQDRTVSSTKSESGKQRRKKESAAEIPEQSPLRGHHELLPPKLQVAHKVSGTRGISRNEDMGNIKTRSEPLQRHPRAEYKSPNSVISPDRREMISKPKFMDSTAHGDHRRRDKEEEEELSKESEGAENSTLGSHQSSPFTCSTRAQDEPRHTKQSRKSVRPEEPNISQSSGIFSLLHLISCGSLAIESDSILNITSLKTGRLAETRKRGQLANSRNKNLSRNKVVDRTLGEELDFMLEDLHIINTQKAEKQYFSGSIVEIKAHGETADPVLTRSASYGAERVSNVEMDAVIEKGNCGRGNKSNCIPRLKR